MEVLLHVECKSPELMDSWWWPLCESRYYSQVTWAKLASWVSRLGFGCPSTRFLSCPQSQCHASSWPREVRAPATLQTSHPGLGASCMIHDGSLLQAWSFDAAAKVGTHIRGLLWSSATTGHITVGTNACLQRMTHLPSTLLLPSVPSFAPSC